MLPSNDRIEAVYFGFTGQAAGHVVLFRAVSGYSCRLVAEIRGLIAVDSGVGAESAMPNQRHEVRLPSENWGERRHGDRSAPFPRFCSCGVAGMLGRRPDATLADGCPTARRPGAVARDCRACACADASAPHVAAGSRAAAPGFTVRRRRRRDAALHGGIHQAA